MKKALFCLFILILVGCSQETSEENTERKSLPIVEVDDVTTTFTHPDTHQEFNIIRTDQYLQNYIDKVKRDPEQNDNYKTYAETFVDPLMEVCLGDSVSRNNAYGEGIFAERPALNRMAELDMLTEKMDEEQVTEQIKEALIHSASLLPGEEGTTVCVFPTTEVSSVDYLGFAYSAGHISIYVNAEMDDSTLVTTVAHEYNHSILFEQFPSVAEGNTLLEHLVFEGKAVFFEEVAYPKEFDGEIYEYDKALWQEAVKHLDDENMAVKEEIMFGSETFPPVYGYKEGYKILSEYLERHPELEIQEWMAASSAEIYEGSEYASYYD
ncbi:DUF2268 domain-containing putative Zn-dependent protease [Terribacillus saccharophilus]|uniref:DUF2268 domain-containing putative Zn-dependent protease n=1 Tax=Terribacillus saccharophilus TaxID=361277 RepID=UPI003981CF0B